MSEDDVMAALDEAGIERSLITGFDEGTSVHEVFIPNDLVADLADRHPGRFIPFAGVDVLKGMDGVRELESLVRDRGFRGLGIRPFMTGLKADDRRNYPLYAKCVELDIPLSIHTSANWTSVSVSDFGHPRHIDTVAVDFPELKIVMSHGGYPWVWRRSCSLGSTRTFTSSLARTARATWRSPVPAGRRSFAMGRPRSRTRSCSEPAGSFWQKPPRQLVKEFKALPVEEEVMDLWLGGNAAAVLAREL